MSLRPLWPAGAHPLDEVRRADHAVVADRRVGGRHLNRRHGDALPDRHGADRRTDHSSSGRAIPGLSPGKSIPVGRPNPNLETQEASSSAPSLPAIVTVPTLDEFARICRTVILSVPRLCASWIHRSAIRICGASTNWVAGVTTPSSSAAAIVTSLNVDPGS